MTSMSETGQMIVATAERVFASHTGSEQLRAAEGGWSAELWTELAESGLPLALEPAGKGAFGLPAADALAVVRAAGRSAAPVPLVEAMFANWLLLSADLGTETSVLSIGGLNRRDMLALKRSANGWRLPGTAHRVPWGRYAETLVLLVEEDGETMLVIVPREALAITQGENLAREPRDDVRVTAELPTAAVRPLGRPLSDIRAQAAGLRAIQMAGALQAVMTLTVGYAQERVQFGRAIAKFQAVQQNIAVVGGQVAAAGAAATQVGGAFEREDAFFALAAAKIRAGEAAGIAARYAHQVHGAIGFTQEYELHFLTKRLWSWRDEFGSEAEWSRLLGQEVCRHGADALWPFLTSDLAAHAPAPLAMAEAAQ